MKLVNELTFPVGYHDFHDDTQINFQLNRWYSLGYFEFEKTREIGQQVISLSDWKEVLESFGEQATRDGKFLEAAFCYRAAEFFTLPSDPDKEDLYTRFTTRLYAAVEGEIFRRISVPYEDAFLPALHFKPEEAIGVIVMNGGLDSFMEEFYSMAVYLLKTGYEVILFEGPGQGAALREQNLYMTYQWEKPVSAVLDYFQIDDVTLIGISLGGYLAPRAAAFEPRISRVVAYDIYIYDHRGGFFQRLLFQFIKRAPSLYNRLLSSLMRRDDTANHIIHQWMFACGMDTPYDWIVELGNYSAAEIVKFVKQDVLLLAGKDDHIIPVEEYYNYLMGLTNAASVSGRIFTSEDQAQNHCQIGNVKLALDFIIEWIESKS
jgi:pimeloyl-ACP methyl ester carboxylesterase